MNGVHSGCVEEATEFIILSNVPLRAMRTVSGSAKSEGCTIRVDIEGSSSVGRGDKGMELRVPSGISNVKERGNIRGVERGRRKRLRRGKIEGDMFWSSMGNRGNLVITVARWELTEAQRGWLAGNGRWFGTDNERNIRSISVG